MSSFQGGGGSTQPATTNKCRPDDYSELISRVESAFPYIQADNHDDRTRAGMALKSGLGEDGFDFYDRLCKESASYNASETRKRYDGFEPNGGITIGTLFGMAKDRGWDASRSNGQAPTRTDEDIAQFNERQEQIEAEHEKEKQKKEALQAETSRLSAQLLSELPPANTLEPSDYAKRKNITYPGDIKHLNKSKTINGTKYRAGADVVPVYSNDGKVNGLQLIYLDRKRLVHGTKKSGSSYRVGDFENPESIIITEGLATALSIYQATSKPVVVAFDAGNLLKVGESVREQFPRSELVYAADNDIKTDKPNTGVEAAHKAAKTTGGVVVVPQMQGKKCDFNDVYVELGADVVAGYFQSIQPRYLELNLEEFLSRDIKPRRSLLHPIIVEKSLIQIFASRGVGKTHVAIGIAIALSTGGEFLGWTAPEPCNVLYIDGEMPAVSMQERIRDTLTELGHGQLDTPERFRYLSHDLQENGLPDLATREGQAEIWPYVKDRDVIILDNYSTLCRGAKENDGDDWRITQEWLLQMRAAGKSVVGIHHAGKSGQQRGTSRREDILDVVLGLRHPSDYDPMQGARFEVFFSKSRGLLSDDVRAFIAQKVEQPNTGRQIWEREDLEVSNYNRIISLSKDGLNKVEIANELGINRSTVYRNLATAGKNGDLPKPEPRTKGRKIKSDQEDES